MKWKTSLVPALFLAATLGAPPARGQMDVPVDDVPANFVGLGIGAAPDYIGSSDQTTVAIPLLRYQFANSQRYLLWFGDTAQLNLLNHRNWRAGPLLRFRQSRDDDVDNDVVRRMDKVDSAVEGGLFVQYNHPLGGRRLHQLVFAGDIEGGSNGAEGRVRMSYWYPFSDQTVTSIGVGMSFANTEWMENYFGVRSANDISLYPSLGGRAYEPSSGAMSVFVPFGVMHTLNPRWMLFAGGRYEKLQGDAKDSPIVREQGDSDQWSFGVGVAYRF